MSAQQIDFSRRTWIRSALAAGGAWAATGIMGPVSAAPPQDEGILKKGGTVLFQGDSITDAGRNRRHTGSNNAGASGRGYPFLVASYLLASRPGTGLECFNRGNSGNKVPDLDARWQTDTIDLKPDLLSILVGVNDIWHKLGGRYNGTVDDYERGFTALIERTKKALPETRIVVCEPFVLRCGAVNKKWFPEFDQRRAAAARVAKNTQSIWVPFQSIFDDAVKLAEPKYWAGDGVHPTMAGHGLMAKAWVETVKL